MMSPSVSAMASDNMQKLHVIICNLCNLILVNLEIFLTCIHVLSMTSQIHLVSEVTRLPSIYVQ